MSVLLALLLAGAGKCSERKVLHVRHEALSPSVIEWSPRHVSVGLELSDERERGFRQSEIAPKLGWSPFVLTAGRSRLGYDTEVYYSEEHTRLTEETSRTRTLGWSFTKLRFLRVLGAALGDHHAVPYLSAGVERLEVSEAGESSASTALSWGAGVDVELGGGLTISLGYRESRPSEEPRHVSVSSSLSYAFGSDSEAETGE